MTLVVDPNVHVPGDYPMAAGDKLPPLDVPDHVPGAVDVIGRQLRTRGVLLIAGAAVGVVGGAACSVGAAWGAVAGAAAGSLVGELRTRTNDRRCSRAIDWVPGTENVDRLRVMEYNVHGGMGGPGNFFATPARLDRLAATIMRERPDVVLLQELDHFAMRSNYIDTLGQLAKRLHPSGAVMTPTIEKVNGRREGTGILTFNGAVITDARGLRIGDALGDNAVRRFRANTDALVGAATAKIGRRWLPFGGVIEYQPRGATDALVRTVAGEQIRVISGHFSPPHDRIDEPPRQLEPIVATLDTWAGPVIVGADFNVRDGSREFRREHKIFEAAGLSEVTAGAPANSDRVYASAHFIADTPRKLVTAPGEVPASDHAPVVVDLVSRR